MQKGPTRIMEKVLPFRIYSNLLCMYLLLGDMSTVKRSNYNWLKELLLFLSFPLLEIGLEVNFREIVIFVYNPAGNEHARCASS